MNWKNKPYWMKGLIILGIISLIIVAIVNFAMFNWAYLEGNDAFVQYLGDSESWSTLGFTLLIFFIPSLLIGAVIGWIYGKVRNRK